MLTCPRRAFPLRLVSNFSFLIVILIHQIGYPKIKSGTTSHSFVRTQGKKQLPPTMCFVPISPTPFRYYYILLLQLKGSQGVDLLAVLNYLTAYSLFSTMWHNWLQDSSQVLIKNSGLDCSFVTSLILHILHKLLWVTCSIRTLLVRDNLYLNITLPVSQ